jgi:hypothetical protein
MARNRKKWSELRAEIYRYLKEEEGTSFWTRDILTDLFNAAFDMRTMQLHSMHEGFAVRQYETDIVAGQSLYSLDDYVGRVKRIIFVDPTTSMEIPLVRDERVTRPLPTINIDTLPTYRIVGNSIKLEPTPARNITDGLKIEVEVAPDRIDDDNEELPAEYPVFCESLLVLDTVVAALGIEEAQAVADKEVPNNIQILHSKFEQMFDMYLETRSGGQQYAVRAYGGD